MRLVTSAEADCRVFTFGNVAIGCPRGRGDGLGAREPGRGGWIRIRNLEDLEVVGGRRRQRAVAAGCYDTVDVEDAPVVEGAWARVGEGWGGARDGDVAKS